MSEVWKQLTVHAVEGRRLKKRLRYAGTRETVAEYVCELRRWHRDLLPLAEACGISLGIDDAYYPTEQEARPVVGPLVERPLVTNRRGEITEAQRTMLVVTAAALSRLAPVLATLAPMPPKSPGGRPSLDPPARIAAIEQELREQRRRGEKRNKEGAIKAVLKGEGISPGGVEFERALARLRKRKSFR